MSENKANIQCRPESGSGSGSESRLTPPAADASGAGIATGAKTVTQNDVEALSRGVWAARDKGLDPMSVQVADPGGIQADTFAGFREGLDTYRQKILPTLSQLECLIVLISYGIYGIETQQAVSRALHRARSMGSLHVDPFIENMPPSPEMPDGYCRIVVACPEKNSRSLVWGALDGARMGNRNRYASLFIE